MATTMTDETNTTTTDPHATTDATSDRPGPPAAETVADQATRVEELRSDLEQADERSEVARKAYLAGVEAGLEPEEIRRLRRAWDNARSARNAVESLVMVQDPEATTPSEG